jgi:hypothetical protein
MVGIGFVLEVSKTSNLRGMAHRPRPGNCFVPASKRPKQLIRMISDHVEFSAGAARTDSATGLEINICHSLVLLRQQSEFQAYRQKPHKCGNRPLIGCGGYWRPHLSSRVNIV